MSRSIAVLRHAAPAVLLALAMAGCGSVLTIAPVIADADAELDPRLYGRWLADDDTEIAIRAGNGNAYAIEYGPVDGARAEAGGEPPAEPARFEGRLGRLGSRLVLDVRPVYTAPEPYDALLIPGHLLFVLDAVEDDRLVVLNLEINTVMTHLRGGDLDLPYTVEPPTWDPDDEESGPESVVIHGTPTELRAALERYLDRPGVLAAPDTLRRLE